MFVKLYFQVMSVFSSRRQFLKSPALGRSAYAKKRLPADHRWNNTLFICGDMNTVIVKTLLGRPGRLPDPRGG